MRSVYTLRDSATRFSTSGFFHESVSHKPLSIPFRTFQYFSKICGDAAQGAPPVLTQVANGNRGFARVAFLIQKGKMMLNFLVNVSPEIYAQSQSSPS
jgi:hypothetical protein